MSGARSFRLMTGRGWLIWVLGSAVVIASALFCGAWFKSHWAPATMQLAHGQMIGAPQLQALPELHPKSVNLVALREQALHQIPKPLLNNVSRTSVSAVDIAATPAKAGRQLPTNYADAVAFDELPVDLKKQIPAFVYNAHVYSSDPTMSYIQLNGKTLYQGDHYLGLTIVLIRYNETFFRFKGQLLKQKALQDWRQ
ncbi:general secretion pathway protein GspB [Celerinatantimonas yamalensis]|uniref:General secretion pathway protein GspB n=1 Tax=Celerinatantimonas yamalensis TaxID=559956 RepID=A0ABW9GC60_9GAMM